MGRKSARYEGSSIDWILSAVGMRYGSITEVEYFKNKWDFSCLQNYNQNTVTKVEIKEWKKKNKITQNQFLEILRIISYMGVQYIQYSISISIKYPQFCPSIDCIFSE